MRAERCAAALVALAIAACTAKEGPKTPLTRRPGLPTVDTSPAAIRNNPHTVLAPEAKAALDSGNADYRAHRYDAALAAYRRASALAPAHGAPYYGIYMAASALGQKAVADSALKAFSARTVESGAILSDSLMKHAHEDTARKT
jgi:hypothetical protein